VTADRFRSACFREEEHMSFVTTEPRMPPSATENLQAKGWRVPRNRNPFCMRDGK
jgi:hypothetical protein